MPQYPTAIPNLANPTGTEPMSGANLHSLQHGNANDEIEAIAAELGVNPKGASTDVVQRLERIVWMSRARHSITGGGICKISTVSPSDMRITWSPRFILMDNGRKSSLAPDGYFDITFPNSQSITGVGGAPNRTAQADGIPLYEWEALYYIVPFGSTSASVPANFRVVNYTSAFDVPDNWILVCQRNSDGPLSGSGYYDEFTFANGHRTTAWVNPGFLNGWVNYGAGYRSLAIRKTNGMVHVTGLIMNGPTTSVICNIPIIFRPTGHEIFAAAANQGIMRVDAVNNGDLMSNGVQSGSPNNAWLSLAGIFWYPEA